MINYSLISPSSIGKYAACTMRLVWDSQEPPPYRSNPYAAFGNVCHEATMLRLGCPSVPKTDDETVRLARSVFPALSDNAYADRVAACATEAARCAPALRPGVRWLAEHQVYSTKYLPDRVSRKGMPGFGGNIDLLAEDDSWVVDLKFVKEPKVVTMTYAWQVASYAILRGADKTRIIYTPRSAETALTADINWAAAPFNLLLERIPAFLNRVTHQDFERYAYPTPTAECEYCEQKHRCPMARFAKPAPHVGDAPPDDGLAALMALANQQSGAPAPTGGLW